MDLTILTEYNNDLSLYAKWRAHLFGIKKITGHYAVTRSVLDGLEKIKYKSYNYNPLFEKELNQNVIVLSGIEVLQKMIKLKEAKKISKIYAGPNIMVRSNEYNGLLGSPVIDKVIVPSEWVKKAYIEDMPSLEEKIIIWAAGVNENLFDENLNSNFEKKILIYNKFQNIEFIDSITNLLSSLNLKYHIINYGEYKLEDYKHKLMQSSLMLFLSNSESQGIAVHEAWFMNVPTFILQTENLVINNKVYSEFSSAPYVEEKNGDYFKNITELTSLLKNFHAEKYTPKKIALEKYTDRACILDLLNKIKI